MANLTITPIIGKQLTIIAPPLPTFEIGDRVKFPMFCFGAERPASGKIIPASEFSTAQRQAIDIAGTICIRYSCQLPAIETLDSIYREVYPAAGLWQGIVQMPAVQVERIDSNYCSGDDDLFPRSAERSGRSPEQPRTAERQRRYSAKGHACGWLEERLGNTKRKNPTTSYYYCWTATSEANNMCPCEKWQQYSRC